MRGLVSEPHRSGLRPKPLSERGVVLKLGLRWIAVVVVTLAMGGMVAAPSATADAPAMTSGNGITVGA